LIRKNVMYTSSSELNGLVVSYIDVAGDEIMITTECGRKFRFYHSQSCCENVYIYDSKGDLSTLKGKKLISVEMDASGDIPEDVDYTPYDYYTWTEVTFNTTEDTVISRWIGESNGYYSESVDLEELTSNATYVE
jgi:hypothetical protein